MKKAPNFKGKAKKNMLVMSRECRMTPVSQSVTNYIFTVFHWPQAISPIFEWADTASAGQRSVAPEVNTAPSPGQLLCVRRKGTLHLGRASRAVREILKEKSTLKINPYWKLLQMQANKSKGDLCCKQYSCFFHQAGTSLNSQALLFGASWGCSNHCKHNFYIL